MVVYCQLKTAWTLNFIERKSLAVRDYNTFDAINQLLK